MLDTFKGLRKELCPFCFEYLRLRETPFRCSDPMGRCKPEVDAVLQRQWGDNRPLGRVIPSCGSFVKAMHCSTCEQKSTKRLCPHCHSELPHTTGETKNYIFAVIGAKESGKSHYLAVLIKYLKEQAYTNLNRDFAAQNEDTIKRYNRDFDDPVFKRHTTITATKSAIADSKVRQPLVYGLTKVSKGLFGGTKLSDPVVLAFFDTAGEDLNAEDTMSVVNKYIYRADGILLLVDPLQLPYVRDQLIGTALPGVNTETADIVTRTTHLVQKGLSLKATGQITIPLAIAFSKFDAVKPLVDDQFQLNSNARHHGGFDKQDFDAVNSEMMALLDSWGGQDIVNQVRARYAKYGFFGISALGCNPHGTDKIPRVLPRRVEDPFLWLLAANGLINTVKKS